MLGSTDCHARLDPSGKFKRDEFSPETTTLPEDLISAMDQHGVERGVIAASKPQDSEYMLQCQRRYPARLHAVINVHPCDADAVPLFKDYISKGAYGLLLDPLVQEFYDTEYGHLAPLVQEAGIMNAHVQVNCRPSLGFSTVDGATRLAWEFPDTRFVLLHAASQRFADLLPVANEIRSKNWRNFYVDVSETIVELRHSPFWEQLRWTLRQLGARHLLFGSGWPRGDMGKTIEAVRDLGFSDEEQRLIFRENMAGILDRRG